MEIQAQKDRPTSTIAKTDYSQEDEEFRVKFNMAKNHLHHGKIERALPIFQELSNLDSTNANINYLLGVCYTEDPIISYKSIYYLEKAVNSIIMKYDIISYKEKGAPIFAYYYLSIAYSQHGKCEEATEAKSQFHSMYGIEKNDYYIRDVQRWIKKCHSKPEASAKKDSLASAVETSIVTKTIDYTTESPLYGVQIGAFSRLDPRRYFNGLKNVEAFMDKAGTIRYVIGHFIHRSQAAALQKLVEFAGYKDAYIVDVNQEKIYSEEVISINNISLKAPKDKAPMITGKVDFTVQIGAFRDSIPIDLVLIYLQVEGIKELSQDDLTLLTVGSLPTYEEAEVKKEELLKMGIPG
ncbi:MAG: SPOR domain-containing protein, partial [Deltaproteobacteria bacterium]|nr:SPOR domain-containing protein [Deltaproteobacteria bacterium]